MFGKSKQGAVDVISGSDALNAETIDIARKIIDSCTLKGRPSLVFDLQHVPLIDSAGLELLLETREACLGRGGLMQIAGLNPLCRDILRVTGHDNSFEIFDDVVSAVGSFAR